ncbi:MAG: DUF6259 domain-containing protein [Sphaerochaeta sp.]|nr:DUF6259 domain-containing protein [Sphaerochaeta sp.]
MNLIGRTFSARYDEKFHTITSMVNTLTLDEYIKTPPTVPLVTLYAISLADNTRIELVPTLSVVSGTSERQEVFLPRFGGKDIEVVVSLVALDDSLYIEASVENKDSSLGIVEILCPHICGVSLGETHEDDVIIYPHHAGERTVNPVHAYGKGRKSFWRAASKLEGDVYRREINYCGLASMSWMYYYDSDNGLYFGSHDPRFPVTGIIAETGAGQDGYMGFAFRKHQRVSAGQRYETGSYRIAITDCDWHYGADIYREYIGPFIPKTSLPEFLTHEFALNQCYNFKRSGTVENTYANIPAMYHKGREWGVKHMFIASWNRNGFDSQYPEYYPDMELGTPMEFADGIELVRSSGGFTTLYINARIFDIKSDFHKSLGVKMAMKDLEGNALYEEYGPEKFTVNCPSDSLWQKYLVDIVEFAFKAYGADGVYLDQLASAEPFACYDPNHSHAGIGDFNNGYIAILKKITERMSKYGPNHYLMTENCGDLYSGYVWSNLTWNGADYDEFYNVYSYTFPSFKQVNMVNPRGWIADEDSRRRWFYKDFQRAILLGNILWMGITNRFQPEGGEYATYAQRALKFRAMLQPHLERATFLDQKHILSISEGCDATTWKLDDGSLMVLCGNPEQQSEASVAIEYVHLWEAMERCGLDLHLLESKVQGDRVVIELGQDRLCCVILKV